MLTTDVVGQRGHAMGNVLASQCLELAVSAYLGRRIGGRQALRREHVAHGVADRDGDGHALAALWVTGKEV